MVKHYKKKNIYYFPLAPADVLPEQPIDPNLAAENQLIHDIQEAINLLMPMKEKSDSVLQEIEAIVQLNQLDYQQEHILRLQRTDWLYNILLPQHIVRVNALISQENLLELRAPALTYKFSELWDLEEVFFYNVQFERYGLRTDIGNLWADFATEHAALKTLIDLITDNSRPTGNEDQYQNVTPDPENVPAGLLADLNDKLAIMALLVDEAHAKVLELQALFQLNNVSAGAQYAMKSMINNLRYGTDDRYIEDMNYLINHNPNPNAATKEQYKLIYNEESLLIQFFINEDVIPPAGVRVGLENEHALLKSVIDAVPT
jgi:hypothetical protein